MGKLNKDNLRKTVYYFKKNGLKNTLYAVAERLQKKDTDSYTYVAPAEEVLSEQRARSWENPVTFSILVPLYHTPMKYFEEMVESVLAQTYPYFQLVLLDAGAGEGKENATVEADGVKVTMTLYEEMVKSCKDDRICYYKLAENKGIAENTNAGLEYATGDYIALLDHDDLLTADALYEMAAAIEEGKKRGVELKMLYSDEDKCNGEATEYYEPHYKLDFNLDLLLTNNYICHFTAVKAEVFKELKLRGEFNGAQDFDLVLRVAGQSLDRPEVIWHIPKILYHWRCHTSSTAANPASKTYAYEAGKRAVEAFVAERGWKARVEHLKHLGFYGVVYEEEIFSQRPDIGAVGGSLLNKAGKVTGGLMTAEGEVVYAGLPDGFSGYMNRAVLTQQAECLDARCIRINPACYEVLACKYGVPHRLLKEERIGEVLCKTEAQAKETSLIICQALLEEGYSLIWEPQWKQFYKEN